MVSACDLRLWFDACRVSVGYCLGLSRSFENKIEGQAADIQWFVKHIVLMSSDGKGRAWHAHCRASAKKSTKRLREHPQISGNIAEFVRKYCDIAGPCLYGPSRVEEHRYNRVLWKRGSRTDIVTFLTGRLLFPGSVPKDYVPRHGRSLPGQNVCVDEDSGGSDDEESLSEFGEDSDDEDDSDSDDNAEMLPPAPAAEPVSEADGSDADDEVSEPDEPGVGDEVEPVSDEEAGPVSDEEAGPVSDEEAGPVSDEEAGPVAISSEDEMDEAFTPPPVNTPKWEVCWAVLQFLSRLHGRRTIRRSDWDRDDTREHMRSFKRGILVTKGVLVAATPDGHYTLTDLGVDMSQLR